MIFVGSSVEIVLYWLVEERDDLHDWTAMSCVLYDYVDKRRAKFCKITPL